MKEKGIDIPDQVQIIGYDGIIDRYTDQYVCSTIEQPIAMMAETAVNMLLNPEDTLPGANICLPVKYVPGGTTKD